MEGRCTIGINLLSPLFLRAATATVEKPKYDGDKEDHGGYDNDRHPSVRNGALCPFPSTARGDCVLSRGSGAAHFYRCVQSGVGGAEAGARPAAPLSVDDGLG